MRHEGTLQYFKILQDISSNFRIFKLLQDTTKYYMLFYGSSRYLCYFSIFEDISRYLSDFRIFIEILSDITMNWKYFIKCRTFQDTWGYLKVLQDVSRNSRIFQLLQDITKCFMIVKWLQVFLVTLEYFHDLMRYRGTS